MKRRLVEVLAAGVRVDTVEECGVKPSHITVNYPHSYCTGRVIRIPAELKTIGDHIRKRRLGLKMFQREVAAQIGTNKTCIFNWEANTSSPETRYMPAIIQFLGYSPLPEANGWAARLVRHRTALGLSQKEAAGRLEVDSGTLARWERGEREPQGAFLGRVNRFLVES